MSRELRQMIWKESYLTGRLVAILIGLGALGIIGMAFEGHYNLRMGRMFGFVAVLTITAAFAIGATMFAGETEYGTDKLFQRLGVPPHCIWQGKLLVGILGILLLWTCLVLFSIFMNGFADIFVSGRMRFALDKVSAQSFWGALGLALEALLCGMICSCLFRRVLTALLSSVGLFLGSALLLAEIQDLFRHNDTFRKPEALLLLHGLLVLLLIVANWFLISRWFANSKRSFSISLTLPRFRSNITSRYHECSPQMRFVTRIIWHELRQHALIWMTVAFFSILSLFVSPYSSPFMLCYVVPLLMGLVSCYSEQNRDRARFWYQRGASTATYWWSKNIVWLSVLGLIFFVPSYFMLVNFLQEEIAWQIENYYSTEYNHFGANLSATTVPQLTDFPSNLWFYVLLLYFIGQWAIVRVPHAILAAVCAVVCSFAGILMMNLCQAAYVPLWLILIPIIIVLALSSYWACDSMLRDLPDPGNRHRWRMALLPLALIICCVLFFGYRTRGVTTMLYYGTDFLYEDVNSEEILSSPDEEYSEKYFELVRSFSSDFEIRKRAAELISKRNPDTLKVGHAKMVRIEVNKIYKTKIKEQKETLLELANLLDARYKSGQPMQINLLKYWRPQIDFMRSDDYYNQMTPDRKFHKLLQHGFYQDEWLFPLTNKEMIHLLWNLNEVHAYLSGDNYSSLPMPLVHSGYLGSLYSTKNLQRVYDHENAQSLRELTKESIKRESRITSMQQIVDLWFAYANHQLDHDNEYVWEYLRGIPWNGSDKAEREQEQYLIEKLFYPPRWTILPTEKFRARTLLFSAEGFYTRQAHLHDTLLQRQFAFNSVSDRIMDRHTNWLQAGDEKRLFTSTPAVRDFADWKMRLFDMYIEIHTSYRKRTTMFALLAFAKENNRYPETLDELVPDYLEKLPVDPWTAKPFGYIGPNFEGKLIVRGGSDDKLTFPLLWSSGKHEAELVEMSSSGSQTKLYTFVSRKSYRDRIFAGAEIKSFEEEVSRLQHNVRPMQFPVLQVDDRNKKQKE